MAQQTGYYDASKYNTGNFFSDILGNIGGLNLGDLATTGLSYAALRDEFGRTSDIAQQAAEGARQIGQEAAAASAFKPFTVTTGFGGVTATPEGGFATALSPQQQARQEALSGITNQLLGIGGGGLPQPTLLSSGDSMRFASGPVFGDSLLGQPQTAPTYLDRLTGKQVTQAEVDALGGNGTYLDPVAQRAFTTPSTGGFGAGVPDVSGIQEQALGGVTGALTAAQAPMATREADVFERIRAVQRPEEERRRLALQEQLQAQGRTGLRTAQFGGSPEQFALAQAQEEAKNRAALAALQQAGSERQQDLAAAQGMFGLGQQAAGLPAVLQAAQLQNIGTGLGLEYAPEQQLLSTLTPATNLSNLVGLGARQGAGLLAETQMSGLEDIIQAELAKNQALSQIYGSLLGAGGQAAAGQGTANIFDQILGGETLGGLFSSIFD